MLLVLNKHTREKMNEFCWLDQVAIVHPCNTKKISFDTFLSVTFIYNYWSKLSYLKNFKFHKGQELSLVFPGACTV